MNIKERFKSINIGRLVRKTFPWTQWLFNYKISHLQYDIIAGLSTGLMLVPQCMAYAVMCNVRPEFGLYSSFMGQFVYMLLGSSKDASVGPSAILSTIGGQLNSLNPMSSTIGDNTYTCFLTLTSGLVLMAVGFLKLGFIVNLFSIPVVSGFTAAAGFVVIASQLKSFFGLSAAPQDPPLVIVKQLKNVSDRFNEIRAVDITFGICSLIFLLFLQYLPTVIERIRAKCSWDQVTKSRGYVITMEVLRIIVASRNVIVFCVGTIVTYFLYQNDPEITTRIGLVGFVKPGLPIPKFPALQVVNDTDSQTPIVLKSFADMLHDCSVDFVIMPMMAMLEIIAMEKALGRKNGYRTNPDRELMAIGAANFVQSFFGAFPTTATLSRSALNDQCRVRTQLASAVSAGVVMLVVGALTDIFYYVPKACLASIMIAAGYNLVDFSSVRPMWREYRPDAFIFAATLIICFFYDIAKGMLIMILINIITFLRPVAAMKLHVEVEIDRESVNQDRITVVRLPHGLKYPSADKFIDGMAHIFSSSAIKNTNHIVLDCHFVSGVDFSGIQALRALLIMAEKKEIHVIFTNLTSELHDKLEGIHIGGFHYAATTKDAIEAYKTDTPSEGNFLQVPSGEEQQRRPSLRFRRPSIVAPIMLPTIKAETSNKNSNKNKRRRISEPALRATTLRQNVNDLMSASISKIWAVSHHTENSDIALNKRIVRRLSKRIADTTELQPIEDDEDVDEDSSSKSEGNEEKVAFLSTSGSGVVINITPPTVELEELKTNDHNEAEF